MNRLEQLREKFKKDEEQKNNTDNYGRDSFYPFWLLDGNKELQIRFLVDADTHNPNIFYIEKKEHTLSINGENKKFPCLTMYGEECPICKLAANYYNAAKRFPKDSEEEKKHREKGKYYYRDRRYLMQAIVRNDPLPVEEGKESAKGKVKIFQFGNEIFSIVDNNIKKMILQENLDPFDDNQGYDFIIWKTKKRVSDKDVANYSSSYFARGHSPTNLAEGDTPMVLSSFLPNKPSLDTIENALNAHLNGIDFDDEQPHTTSVAPQQASSVSSKIQQLRNKKVVEESAEDTSAEDTSAGGNTDVDVDDGVDDVQQLRSAPAEDTAKKVDGKTTKIVKQEVSDSPSDDEEDEIEEIRRAIAARKKNKK